METFNVQATGNLLALRAALECDEVLQVTLFVGWVSDHGSQLRGNFDRLRFEIRVRSWNDLMMVTNLDRFNVSRTRAVLWFVHFHGIVGGLLANPVEFLIARDPVNGNWAFHAFHSLALKGRFCIAPEVSLGNVYTSVAIACFNREVLSNSHGATPVVPSNRIKLVITDFFVAFTFLQLNGLEVLARAVFCLVHHYCRIGHDLKRGVSPDLLRKISQSLASHIRTAL